MKEKCTTILQLFLSGQRQRTTWPAAMKPVCHIADGVVDKTDKRIDRRKLCIVIMAGWDLWKGM